MLVTVLFESALESEVDAAVAASAALRRDVLLQLRTLFWKLADEQARAVIEEVSLLESRDSLAALLSALAKEV